MLIEKSLKKIPGDSGAGSLCLTAALSVSGFPAAPSHFFGFLSTKSSAREQELERALSYDGTLIFYEAPHRIVDFAERLDRTACGRKVVFARELTKIHEQLIRVVAGQCADWFADNSDRIRGEFVVLVGPGSADRTQASVDAIGFFVYLLVNYHHQKQLHWHLSSLECRSDLYRQLTGETEA